MHYAVYIHYCTFIKISKALSGTGRDLFNNNNSTAVALPHCCRRATAVLPSKLSCMTNIQT